MRERLAEFYQETICVTARFQSYANTNQGSNVACFYNIRLDDRQVADHVWVHRSGQMKKLDLKHGDIVQFEARVGKYARGEPMNHISEVQYEYNLEKIRELRVLKRANGEVHE